MRILLFCCFAWAGLVQAQEVLPSLPPVSSPALSTGDLGDPAYARYLSNLGYEEGALNAWLHVAHTSSGAAQADALLEAMYHAVQTKNFALVRRLTAHFRTQFPAHPALVQTRFFDVLATQKNERNQALHRLQADFANSPLTREAMYHAVFDYAQESGHLAELPFADTRADQLAEKLTLLQKNQPSPLILALIPGAAHLYYGAHGIGFLYMMASLGLVAAFLWAAIQFQWLYSGAFLLLLVTLAWQAALSGQKIMRAEEKIERQVYMQNWIALQPKTDPKNILKDLK